MSWHPNSNKHKANHCGYKRKPTKREVSALMSMYAASAELTRVMFVKERPGVQLKLSL